MVSVVIPAYNAEAYIREALESVLSQTYTDYEIIVVDDGSTDRTLERVRAYGTRIVLLTQDHKGPAAARNRALQAAKGPLIAFLDADDVWLPEKLQLQVGFAEAHPEYGIVTCDLAFWDGSKVIMPAAKQKLYRITNGFVADELLFQNWVSTSCALVRRECFEKVGYFDEEPGLYGEDWLMWVQIAAHYPVYFMEDELVRVRTRPDSHSRQSADRQFESLFRGLEKIAEIVPFFSSRPKLIQKAAFSFAYDRAWDHMRREELDEARRKLRRGLEYKPYSTAGWATLVLFYMPRAILRLARTAIRCARQVGQIR